MKLTAVPNCSNHPVVRGQVVTLCPTILSLSLEHGTITQVTGLHKTTKTTKNKYMRRKEFLNFLQVFPVYQIQNTW